MQLLYISQLRHRYLYPHSGWKGDIISQDLGDWIRELNQSSKPISTDILLAMYLGHVPRYVLWRFGPFLVAKHHQCAVEKASHDNHLQILTACSQRVVYPTYLYDCEAYILMVMDPLKGRAAALALM